MDGHGRRLPSGRDRPVRRSPAIPSPGRAVQATTRPTERTSWRRRRPLPRSSGRPPDRARSGFRLLAGNGHPKRLAPVIAFAIQEANVSRALRHSISIASSPPTRLPPIHRSGHAIDLAGPGARCRCRTTRAAIGRSGRVAASCAKRPRPNLRGGAGGVPASPLARPRRPVAALMPASAEGAMILGSSSSGIGGHERMRLEDRCYSSRAGTCSVPRGIRSRGRFVH